MSATDGSDSHDPEHPDSDAGATTPETTAPLSYPTSTAPRGAFSGGLSEQDAAAVEALPAGNALLVVPYGPDAGSRFLLDTDDVRAGRDPGSDIFLDDITVSRDHAVFSRRADGYHLSDTGSLNGTYLNGSRIEDGPLLEARDEIQIGKYHLVYFSSTSTATTR